MTISKLSSDEYNPYYQPYIDKVGGGDIHKTLKNNREVVTSFFKGISNDRLSFRYAEDKWTIKEILLHVIDTERVFAYRALCIARQDKTKLPGFDQDAYVAYCHANERTLESLLSEYNNVRAATVSLFESFDDKALTQIGIASESALSVRAVAFIIVGHENHHLQIIKARYL
ncbi:DinB family protein [Gelidibacter algens]|uniref:DinB family protein n=1 Tax=Gelidibacter algens TaxID=49280 RepID=A0A1A7QWW4_9FLAO|nr:DinB family protein [Gelidibacter algens]OBX23773.1 damage-inducible protein DinB [Gelidibacter algens]RAJ27452.1 DinB family protein [Gelidibacter algens]